MAQEIDADLEILVGDDASGDSTPQIISELAAGAARPIQIIRHVKRLGASTNMQSLLTVARGDFIARLDGDDYWLPGKLQRQLQFLRDNPTCVASYTNAITVDETGRTIGLFNDAGDRCFSLSDLLRRGNFLNNSSMLVRASMRPPWLQLRGPLLDYRIHLLHARGGCIGHLSEPLVAYRVSSMGSMVASENSKVRQLYWDAINSVPRELVSDLDFAAGIADFYRRVLFRAVRTMDLGLVRQWWGQVKTAAPTTNWRTLGLVAESCCRAGIKELAGRLCGLFGYRYHRVLYRR